MSRLPLVLLSLALVTGTGRADPAPLPRSTPEAEGMDSAGIRGLVEALNDRIDSVHSLMLLRHGRVVAEGWWSPYSRDDVHILYSVTKSFTSTAIGFAAQEGRLTINDHVLSFFPELAPAHPSANLRAMRIRDLLRMNSGHQKDTIDRLRTHADGAWRKAFLELDVENKPGTRFVYNSGASYMLAAIVQQVTGQTVESYLEPRLFAPLGIARHPWGLSREGIALGDGGLSLRAEDLAKFGQLYLQKGMWQGREILAPGWVAAATAMQTANGGNPDSNWDHGYGYQFWMNKTTGYRADGSLGQFCFVLPEYDVVLVVTSGTANLAGLMDLVWQHLLPALRYVALPPNPAEQAKLAGRLAGLALPVQAGAFSSARESGVTGRTYSFPANEQGIASARLDFSGAQPVIEFQDATGVHAIPCGRGVWIRGRTGFQQDISRLFDQPDQGIAACGAWTGPDVFTAKLCFDETPYVVTYRFTFDGEDRLRLDIEYNVRWGPTKLAPIVGTRRDPK